MANENKAGLCRVSSGNLRWEGIATDMDDAVRKALDTAPDGTTLGEVFLFAQGNKPCVWVGREPMMQRLGIVVEA